MTCFTQTAEGAAMPVITPTEPRVFYTLTPKAYQLLEAIRIKREKRDRQQKLAWRNAFDLSNFNPD
jgi:hypothetical protein